MNRHWAKASLGARIAQFIFATILLIIGAALVWLGGQLVVAGGSPYYVVAGVLVIAAAILLWRGDRRGAHIYGLMLLGTWIWAFWEVGLDTWALVARVGGPTILGLWFLTPWAYPRGGRSSGAKALAAAVVLVIAAAGFVYLNHAQPVSAANEDGSAANAPAEGDWPVWARDAGGQRFSPLAQITPENVGKLEKVWEYRTGFKPEGSYALYEVTPLKIGDALYLCTPDNDIVALDAETGAQRWRFAANSKRNQKSLTICRGVAYYRNPSQTEGACAERIITATVDARLIAVDARKGAPCPDFGKDGVVDLTVGMGLPAPGNYYVSSAPAIVHGKVIFGGLIPDNRQIGMPSGAIRAYDAVTGKFAWAFDAGRPDDQSEPAAGQTYTPNTPNSWAPISGDENLGLVYLPTGNASPDWFGGLRRPFDDKFSSAVVALEADTGKVRWVFQTAHHDIWDYDIATQPVLYDMQIGNGRVPALIQPTKRGEIFVLDRRTGEPLLPVEERPVPQTDVAGEYTAPTQPFSTGMPSLSGPELTEKRMWGITPIDQAWCRLEFRKSGYKGPMTPVRVNQLTLVSPGYSGGSDWGGIAIDGDQDILIAPSLRLSIRAQLIPREDADKMGIKPIPGGPSAMTGTPYAILLKPFLSPLAVPCEQPPWGLLSAIDLKTHQLLWSKPFGTARNSGPLTIPSRLPFPIGVPVVGGPMVTKSGLTFLGASADRYFRAIDTKTGKEVWRADLPTGGHANPMTYMSPSGRQIVVIAAGGYMGVLTAPGDYLVAYALPKK